VRGHHGRKREKKHPVGGGGGTRARSQWSGYDSTQNARPPAVTDSYDGTRTTSKVLQGNGVRVVKLTDRKRGWESSSPGMTPEQIDDRNLFRRAASAAAPQSMWKGRLCMDRLLPRFLINRDQHVRGARPHALRRRFRLFPIRSTRVPQAIYLQSGVLTRRRFRRAASFTVSRIITSFQTAHQSPKPFAAACVFW